MCERSTVRPVDWNDMRMVQSAITFWANKQFPNRTDHQALSKAVLEEIPELLMHKREYGTEGIGEELADVFILLMDLATLWGVDLPDAIERKMLVNYDRTWHVDAGSGIAQHIGELE